MKILILNAIAFFLMPLSFTQNQDDNKISSLFCGLPLNDDVTNIIETIKNDPETFMVINEDEQSFGALVKNYPVLDDFQGESMVMTIFHPNKKVDKRFHYGIWVDANYGMDARAELLSAYDEIRKSLEAQAEKVEEKDIEYYDYLEGQTFSVHLSPESKYPEIEVEWFITLPGIHYLKIAHRHYTDLQ